MYFAVHFSVTRSLEDGAADDDVHDFIRALKDLVHAAVSEVALDGVVFQIAVAAVQLQAAVDDVEALRGERGGDGEWETF